MNEALGLIEVHGYLGAIASCDAALKAADVVLLNAQRISGGLTTIELSGDVAAVRSAVESGTRVAQSLGVHLSSHVIARMDGQTSKILTSNRKKATDTLGESEKAQALHKVPKEQEGHTTESQSAPVENILPKSEEKKSSPDEAEESDLTEETVVDLRKIARSTPNISLSAREIKYATKATLLKAIDRARRKGGE